LLYRGLLPAFQGHRAPQGPYPGTEGSPFLAIFFLQFFFFFWVWELFPFLPNIFFGVCLFLTPPRAFLCFSQCRKPFLRISTLSYQALLWTYYKCVTIYRNSSLLFRELIISQINFFRLCVPGISCVGYYFQLGFRFSSVPVTLDSPPTPRTHVRVGFGSCFFFSHNYCH